MKTIIKNACPPCFARYVAIFPDATWESMRNDAANGGDEAYAEAREHLVILRSEKNMHFLT